MIDSRLGGMDMLTKPLAIWGPTIGELPESERRLILGSGGFTGLLCAFLVVGGMDYDRLFDWGIEPAAKKIPERGKPTPTKVTPSRKRTSCGRKKSTAS